MDCTLPVEFGSSEHLARVFAKATSERVPLCGAFDLTYRCDFRCAHCYAGHLVAQSAAESTELSTQEAVEVLNAAAEAGCLNMLLSGGEPLLRRDFFEIYTEAKKLGLIITLFTNASLVTERHAAVFADLPPHAVEVSVYGATEATYEAVTGVAGSFERAWRGIRLLLDHGVNVVLKTMIMNNNLHEVSSLEQQALDLGLRFRMDPVITPRLDGDLSPLATRAVPEEAVAVELRTPERRQQLASFVEQHLPADGGGFPDVDRVYRCGAAQASFHIDPRGFMHPCLMSPAIAYDVREYGFAAAWERVKTDVDTARWEGTGGCADCSDILLCGYCPGLFELEKTTAAQPPDYVCRVGHSRYTAISVH